MKTIKAIGYTILVLGAVLAIWFAASFVDIATKNHLSDSHYMEYSKWNIIIILNDYAIAQRS